MERALKFLKSRAIKVSQIEQEAGLYPTKLAYALKGLRTKFSEKEQKEILRVLKRYGFTEK